MLGIVWGGHAVGVFRSVAQEGAKVVTGHKRYLWDILDEHPDKNHLHGRLRPWPFNRAGNRNPPRRKNRSAKRDERKGRCVRVLCGDGVRRGWREIMQLLILLEFSA